MKQYKIVCGILLVIMACGQGLAAQETGDKDALKAFIEGRYERAIALCKDELAIEGRPVDRRLNSYTVLCWSLLALNRTNEVFTYGFQALRLAPNDIRVLEIIGEAYYLDSNYVKAVEYFERFVRQTTIGNIDQFRIYRVFRAYKMLGASFIALKEFHHADIAFSVLIQYWGLGGGEYNSAAEKADIYERLGYVREQAGNYAMAKEAYQTALSYNSRNQQAISGLARIEPLLNN